MFHLPILRLSLASIVLLTTLAGLSNPSAAQDARTRDLLGFAAKQPEIYEQLGLVSTYGFRWMTPANAMKMDTIGGCEGYYNFAPADELLAIAAQHDLRVHGHALVWHSQTSWCAPWFTKQDLRAYVRTVTSYYCGKVESMDVVNEALGELGGFRGADESVWYALYGDEEYVVAAFKWARRACPEMKLYYNDYGIEYGPKAADMLALVTTLNERGLIDGVGFQSHLTMEPINLEKYGQTMDAVAAIGLEVAISELDIRWNRNYWELTGADLAAQGDYFRQLAELCAERPACVRFTTWGLDDGHSWVNTWLPYGGYQDAPLLFDRDLQPKPAYCNGIQPVFDLPRGECG